MRVFLPLKLRQNLDVLDSMVTLMYQLLIDMYLQNVSNIEM